MWTSLDCRYTLILNHSADILFSLLFVSTINVKIIKKWHAFLRTKRNITLTQFPTAQKGEVLYFGSDVASSLEAAAACLEIGFNWEVVTFSTRENTHKL